jgi:hypothetical protein
MLRTIRKYNKWILVIGGSLLMVTFLVTGAPGALQGDPTKRTVLTVAGRGVTVREVIIAEREFQILKDLIGEDYFRSFPGELDKPNAWLLLSTEAQRAGLVGGPRDGREAIAGLADAIAQNTLNRIDPSVLAMEIQRAGSTEAFVRQYREQTRANMEAAVPALAGQAQMSVEDVEKALAKFRGVQRLMELTLGGPRLSEARLVQEARREMDQATIDAVVVPADAIVADVPEPTPDEIAAHFARFRGVRPGEGEGLGFGYMQPPRVKLAYMTIDRQAVANAIALDPLEVNKHWQQNRTSYPGEFAAERPRIEAVLREQRVDAVMAEIDRVVKARVAQATRPLELDGAHKVLPADWDSTRPSLETLALDAASGVREFLGVSIPPATITRREGAWIPVAELDALPGVGQAAFTSATARLRLSGLVGRVRELSRDTELELQARVPFVASPLIDAVGNRYYIEVLDARTESVAESIEEVGADMIARDARVAKAFERLTVELPELRVAASLRGLDAVKEIIEARNRDAQITPIRQVQVSRSRVSFLAQQINEQALRDAVMNAADAIPPAVPLDQTTIDQRTVAVPLPTRRGVVVAQIVGREPVTRETLRAMGPSEQVSLLINERRRVLPTDTTFDFDAVAKRLGFVDREAAAATPATPATPAAPAGDKAKTDAAPAT